MGKVVLRSHHVDNDLYQDGYYGIVPGSDQNMVMPVEDNVDIDRFIKAFSLERQKDDSGLSVIVPWPHHEITEAALIKAVFSHYFYAILSGDLQVIVETSGIETLLDNNNILSEARKLTDDQGVLKLIELAQWTVYGAADSRHTIGMPNPQRAWTWGKEIFPDGTLQTLNEELQNGERVAVRVPVTVRKKDGTHTQSFFDVHMASDDSNEPKRPVFIRDGIMVADVRAPSMRAVRALVVVNDPPLSEFLRKAENPSHTVWHGRQLKDDYVSGVSDLRFVVDSVRNIYDIIMTEDKEEDKRLLADVFPKPGKGKQRTSPPPRPPYFSISRVSGGFRVSSGKEPLPVGSLVQIQAAYDIRRGNALKKYVRTDFRLDEDPNCL